MQLWRISAFPGLSGLGGHHTDGRWHTLPRSVIYAAEHPALAMVEVLAHMRLSLANIPSTLQLIRIDVAPGASMGASPALPVGWQANEPTSQVVGNRWLDGGGQLLLPVPSALIPHATNYLINAAHPQVQTHLLETIEPFWFDKRYLR
ncbi:RES family NAD+ phosphorylase [Pseudomonas rhodesiae]|uniref:RES family NAD+ phosphorylase n=1 Tax=Pseudomonas rhodesiae TaxID=76760 RepID=UPI00241CC1E5|nr:RES family NAD+ phosphorylase [Pseudomonas rhodesiae]